MSKVFFITGAGRGMGQAFVREALAVGHQVVATGRSTEAVRAAVERFGRSDVLVNDVANCCLGHFEELSPEQVENQLTTNLIGPMNVIRTPPRSSASRGMESPDSEIAEYGFKTTIVEQGAFRTSLREPESTTHAELSVEDYAERTGARASASISGR